MLFNFSFVNTVLKLLVNVQEIIAVLIVLFVFVGYMKFLFKKEN
ncbi:hypothetical protein [Parvimonas parva]|nr:hypothetical protein [Parvimonas parva]